MAGLAPIADSIFAMSSNYLTTREAARILGVSVRSIQQWAEKGWLETWKTEGGHRRISHDSVEKLRIKLKQPDVPDKGSESLSVMVIEYDESLRKLYLIQLGSWSFVSTIYTAPNGFDGLVLLGEMKPDLLICDLRLPGVNGFQIVRSVRDMMKLKDLEIIVISGLPVPEINAHGGLPERVHVMGKPIHFESLKVIALDCWNRKMAR